VSILERFINVALERLARQIKLDKFTAIKWIFYHGRNVDKQTVRWAWSGTACPHFPSCDCDLLVAFHPIYNYEEVRILRRVRGSLRETSEMLIEALAQIEARFKIDNGQILKKQGAADEEYVRLMLMLAQNENVKLIQQPISRSSCPMPSELRMPAPTIVQAVRDADVTVFSRLLHKTLTEVDFSRVWQKSPVSTWEPDSSSEIPTLKELAMRQLCGYNMAFGTQNGRLGVVSAMAGLFDNNKWARTVLKQQKAVATVTPELKSALALVPKALTYLYHSLDTKKNFERSMRKLH